MILMGITPSWEFGNKLDGPLLPLAVLNSLRNSLGIMTCRQADVSQTLLLF